jgi:two-component system nitrogen regulation sensor histidine kinase NtrY
MRFIDDWKNTTFRTMKLKTKYLLFVVIIHLVGLGLSYFIFRDNKILFIVSEIFIIISIALSWQLYLQLIQPLRSLMQGVQAIKDKDFNVKFLPTGKFEVDELISVYNQMMDELKAERTRQEQQHYFLEQIVRSSPTGMVILDFDGRIQQINPKALEITGLQENSLLGRDIKELEHPLFRQISALNVGDAQISKFTGVHTYKLQKSNFIDRGFYRHFILIEDLTAELLEAEKKVYGKVIRMMAHEVNNTVGAVNSIMQSAFNHKTLWEHAQTQQLKNAIGIAIDRNQNLNLFMRNFAELVKLPAPNLQPLALYKLLRNVSALMENRALKSGIEFEFDLQGGAFQIQGDEQLLEQALINIIKNAIEAIGTSGKITFHADPNKRRLVISDTGAGLTQEQAENMFTPFYSTKKDGQGIGLTIVREILLNHNFRFSLKTIAEKETAFTIEF